MPFLHVGDRQIRMSVAPRRGRTVYRLATSPPGVDATVKVMIDMNTSSRPWQPHVFTDAPDCQRHRYSDGSLCMWWGRDADAHRWVLADGFAALVHYIDIHLYQEACCRAGEPWPGDEAPGSHPRRLSCTTCGGEGP